MKCPECGGKLVRDDFETVCVRCGLVVNENFDRQREEYVESNVDNLHHFSSFQRELGTEVDKEVINGRQRYLQKEDEYHNILRRYCSNLNLPQSVERFAMNISDDLENIREGQGRHYDRDILLSAVILFSTRELKVIRTIEEIMNVSGVEKKKELLKTYREIMNELNYYQLPPGPKNFVEKFCSELGLSNKYRAEVKDLIKNNEKCWVGKKPKGVVAGAIYYVSQQNGSKLTQEDVANHICVDALTIRKRVKDIEENAKN